jgi:hypothetical protein
MKEKEAFTKAKEKRGGEICYNLSPLSLWFRDKEFLHWFQEKNIKLVRDISLLNT